MGVCLGSLTSCQLLLNSSGGQRRARANRALIPSLFSEIEVQAFRPLITLTRPAILTPADEGARACGGSNVSTGTCKKSMPTGSRRRRLNAFDRVLSLHERKDGSFQMFATTPSGRRIWVIWRYDREDEEIPDVFGELGEVPIFVITAY